jgi:hypothetical protein
VAKDGKYSTDLLFDAKPKSVMKENDRDQILDDIYMEKDVKADTDLLLMSRFHLFEHSCKELCELFDGWERSTGELHPITAVDSQLDGVDDTHHAPVGRKGKKSDKHDKSEKMKTEKDERKEKNKEIEICDGEPCHELREERSKISVSRMASEFHILLLLVLTTTNHHLLELLILVNCLV